MSDDIKKFWDSRADIHDPGATTDDPYLRKLEFATIGTWLKGLDVPYGSSVLDVGCGDGYTTARLARALDGFAFHGIDYSENMIEAARSVATNATFSVADVTTLILPHPYEVVISDRCLINLATVQDQAEAIKRIADHVKQGGYFIAIENFIEGHNNMNLARASVGLPAIPVRWHNLYFREVEFEREARQYFRELKFIDFASSYYFATRVVEPAITGAFGGFNERAVNLPPFGQFAPVRMVVMKKWD